MKIAIIGSGGREHALAWKISQSPEAGDVFVAPGNAGTGAECQNVDLAVDDDALRFDRGIAVGAAGDLDFTLRGDLALETAVADVRLHRRARELPGAPLHRRSGHHQPAHRQPRHGRFLRTSRRRLR